MTGSPRLILLTCAAWLTAVGGGVSLGAVRGPDSGIERKPAAVRMGPTALPSGGSTVVGTVSGSMPQGEIAPAVGERGAGAEEGGEKGQIIERMVESSRRQQAREYNLMALKHHKEKDYPAALKGFKKAYELEPNDPEIVNNLAYLYHLLGNEDEAEQFYRIALSLDPDRYSAHVNLADLLIRKGQSEEKLELAARLLVRARELRGNQPRLILRQARVARMRNHFSEAERFYMELLAAEAATDERRLEVGDFYRDFGNEDEALVWYRQIKGSGESGSDAAQRIWQIEVERKARQFGWTSRPEEVPSRVRILVTRARVHLGRKEFEQAARMAREAVALSPRHSAAALTLGDVLLAMGDYEGAEVAWLKGVAVDHGNAELHARLGELYLGDGSGKRAGEAAIFLAHALELQPEWTSLRLKLARAWQLSGNIPHALDQVNRFLAEPIGEGERREGEILRRELLGSIPSEAFPIGGELPDMQREVDGTVARTLAKAQAYMARSEFDSAMAILRGLPDADRGPEVLNLEARMLLGTGGHEEAAALLERSLELESNQPSARALLGLAYLASGESKRAREQLEAAAKGGDLPSLYHLARLLADSEEERFPLWIGDMWGAWHLFEARELLESYLGAGTDQVFAAEAEALLSLVERRLREAMIAGGLLLLLLLTLVALFWRWRWGGIDLKTLVEEHPETGPEVQRILSSIRHEVLKHNTTILAGLIDAIGRGDDPTRLAAHLHGNLFGAVKEEAIFHRMLTYVGQLEQLGRSQGRRLNLLRKDEAISTLMEGFSLLNRAAPLLYRIQTLPPSGKSRLLELLSTASVLLNEKGYGLVKGLLDRLRTFRVGAEWLEGVSRRVLREPGFSDLNVPPTVAVSHFSAGSSDDGCVVEVVVPAAALEEILANLLRNALQSSIRSGVEPVAAELTMSLEVDPVTGLERAVFQVLDASGEPLTTEMVRGAGGVTEGVGRGLGITAGLVSRFDGSIEVVEGSGRWKKAVAVSFPAGVRK